MADLPVRIAVLIPSRGRPQGLAVAIATMREKESGTQRLQYVIGCDADDDATIAVALDLSSSGLPVIPNVAARQPSLGGLINLLATRCAADVYVMLGDDVRILTKGWDLAVADAWRKNPDGVWWWSSHRDVTYAAISENWRRAAGRLLTDYFPCWWDDLWLVEVQRYVLGRTGGERLEAWLQDRSRATHRMRDLQIWHDFFYSAPMREQRKAEARRIAERLGRPRVASVEGLALEPNLEFDAADLEAKQGDRSPPTPEYLTALNRAKALMQKEAA